jgi:hypothetical protein
MDKASIVKVRSSEGNEIEDFENHVLQRNERLIIEVSG